jgi:protein PhnA
VSDNPPCQQCGSEYVYTDGTLHICPECGHEWPIGSTGAAEDDGALVVKDVNGNVLHDGDSITVIKDLKVKGTSAVVKVGTKVRNIRLVEGDHNIDCKVDGVGSMSLKSEFVKKA